MDNNYSIEQIEQLTFRELSVGELLTQGLSNKQIGNALGLATGTVKNYSSNLINKLGATNRVEAAVMLAESGIFPKINLQPVKICCCYNNKTR